MAFVVADRVQETTTSTGTGTITLAGAVTGFQSFAAVGDGNNTFYTIADQSGSNWEVGIGTYTSSGTTLSRDTVLSSSNSGSLVNFSAGTKNVFVTQPSSRSAYAATVPSNGQLLIGNGSGFSLATLTAGSGISVSNSSGGITITNTGGGGGGLTWQSVQSTGFTAVAGNAYPCNTTSAAFTVTLPASPAAGNVITLTDYAGTWGTNNLTVNPNGLKINGGTANATLSTNRGSVQLVYVDSTQGWVAYSGFAATSLPQVTPTVDWFVVAGGGSGAGVTTLARTGGGGGAGGFRAGTALSVTAGTTYNVTVGAGGATATLEGNNGNNSAFSSITSTAGGAGGFSTGGQNGGSGGGGGGGNAPATITGGTGNTPSVSPSQGNNGGSAAGSNGGSGGGGGGASAIGGTGSDPGSTWTSGSGGTGSLGPSFANGYGKSGDSTSGSGNYFAGGGGGGAITYPGISTTAGSGGTGGGGPGGKAANGTAGAANTGSGGGGAGSSPSVTNFTGGAGGSGIVIIAYPSIYPAATSTTGSPTVTISGGNRIYAWTGNGSITF